MALQKKLYVAYGPIFIKKKLHFDLLKKKKNNLVLF